MCSHAFNQKPLSIHLENEIRAKMKTLLNISIAKCVQCVGRYMFCRRSSQSIRRNWQRCQSGLRLLLLYYCPSTTRRENTPLVFSSTSKADYRAKIYVVLTSTLFAPYRLRIPSTGSANDGTRSLCGLISASIHASVVDNIAIDVVSASVARCSAQVVGIELLLSTHAATATTTTAHRGDEMFIRFGARPRRVLRAREATHLVAADGCLYDRRKPEPKQQLPLMVWRCKR